MRRVIGVLLAAAFVGSGFLFAQAAEEDDAAWCTTLSFQGTKVRIAQGQTKTFLVRAVCPQGIELGNISFPDGISGTAKALAEGLRITIAVPYEKESSGRRGEHIVYRAPDGTELVVANIRVVRAKDAREEIDFAH